MVLKDKTLTRREGIKLIGRGIALTLTGCSPLNILVRQKGSQSGYLNLGNSTGIWYERRNGKKGFTPVVFIHGNAQNHTTAQETLRYLNELGHSVVLYDLPGHGKSEPHQDGHYSMERFSETLDGVLRKTGTTNPILIGHSMGGMVALQYATTNPSDISGLVLIDTADVDPVKVNKGIPLDKIVDSIVKKSYESFKEELRGKTYRYDQNPQLTEEDILRIGLQYTVPEALDGNFRATTKYDVRQNLVQINVSTLIVRGESDALMTAEMTEEMQKRIPGSRRVTIPDYGHNFLIQRPDILRDIINENYTFLVGK